MTKTKKATEESTSFSSSEHQFQPREDDEEVLWDVIDIIDEKRAQYLVNWAGVDPATKKPWKPSWVAKGDVTDDLVEKWKKHKKERQGSAAARRKKSRKRGSTLSTTGAGETPKPMSTRISVSTAKYSTPTKPGAAGPSSRRTVRLGPATPIEDNESVEEEPSLSKTVWSANGTRNGRPIPKESERHKRKRESSIASTSSATSLPEIITVHKASLSTPPARPRKKRKIAFTPGDGDDSQEETPSIKRVKSNGGSAGALSKKIEIVASEKGDDEEIVAKPVLSGNTTSKPRLDPEPDSSNRVNGVMERGGKPVVGAKSPINGIHDRRSKPPSPVRRIVVRGAIASRTGKDSVAPKTASGQLRPGSPPSKPSQTEKRPYTPRDLSPETVRRLKQFDVEMEALEAEQRKGEAEEAERRAKQAQIREEEEEDDDDRISLEYCDEFPVPAAPFGHPPEPSSPPRSPARPPASKENPLSAPKVANPIPLRPPDLKTKAINKVSDDYYRQGIVPETEPEDSGNTQSQELSLTQSQTAPLAGSPPSMTVEPPASLRSPAPTPARPTIISKMRPRTPSSRSESLSNLELPHILVMERIDEESHYADVSAPHDSIETDSQEFRKNQQNPVPLKDEVKRNGKAGATTSAPVPYILGARTEKRLYVLDKRLNSTIEDIEQFTTPEKRTKDGVKPNGDGKSKKTGTSSPESDAIRRHGMELADAARRAKLQSRPPAPKRSLTDILHDRKSMERATAAVRLSALSHLPPSSIETPSSSILVPDSDRGLPEVPEEVVQEMERAYVNLDGGMNSRTDDDTLEDSGLSRPVEGTRTVLAVRHEEEESTQDLLQEAKAAVDQAEGAQESDADAVPMDGIEAPEVMALDDKIVSDMLQTGEPEALPTTDRADKLVALLQQERTRNQNLHEEIASLRRALELAKGSTSSNELGQRLKDVEVALEEEKVAWNAERTSLMDAVENATKGKESALKDIDFFREQYARASGFVTSTREENKELEKRAKIAEDQAKSGVAMIKATYENKVKELERHMEKWQTMATFLIQKDYRTENDQLRRRAAEHPELKAKCWSLEANVSFLTSEISQLGKDRDRMESELDYWKQEAERVSAELNNSRVEMERFIQASTSGEMVYRCLWRTDENKPCDEVVQTIEELRNHLYSAGHLRLD